MHQEIKPILLLTKTLSIATIFILLWIIFAKVDIVSHTTGQIAPYSKIKSINVLNTSIVQDILVKEGDFVQEGQLVAKLDSKIYKSQESSLITQLELDKLSLRRIESILEKKNFIKLESDNQLLFQQAYAQYLSQKNTHEAFLAEAQANYSQTTSEHASNLLELDKLQNSKDMWLKQIDSYENLKKQKFISEIGALEKINQGKEKLQEIDVQKKRIESSLAKINQSNKNIDKIRFEFNLQLLQEKNQLLSKINDVEKQLSQAKHQVQLTELVSPTSGIVKELSISTKGAVLNEGSILMTIVPKEDKLQANVWLANEDIGHVNINDTVKIKIQSFPFQKYGLINGKVTYISADSKEDSQPQSDHSNKSYIAHVSLDKDYVGDNQLLKIKSGMQIQADIKTGERTIFEYLISPMQKIISEAAGER